MRRVHRPPVVDGNIEDGEEDDKEGCRPLGFEAHGDHDASDEPDERHQCAPNAPFSLDDEAEEEKDEENAAGKEEADVHRCFSQRASRRGGKAEVTHYFLRSFSERLGRPAKSFLRVIIESLKTMKSPPMTLRLRRKKLRSKISPYPKP